MTYVSVNRSVEARTGNYDTPYDSDNGPRRSQSSRTVGRFDAAVGSSYTEPGEATVLATVSQHSGVGAGAGAIHVRGTGELAAHAGPADYDSRLLTTFDATAGTRYSLSAAFDYVRPNVGFLDSDADQFHVRLRQVGPARRTLLDEAWANADVVADDRRPAVASDGVLAAGT